MTFAERLKSMMTTSGVTSSVLARRSGVSRNTISHLKSGRNHPSWDTVQRLRLVLGCSAEDLKDDGIVLEPLPEGEGVPALSWNLCRKARGVPADERATGDED